MLRGVLLRFSAFLRKVENHNIAKIAVTHMNFIIHTQTFMTHKNQICYLGPVLSDFLQLLDAHLTISNNNLKKFPSPINCHLQVTHNEPFPWH